LLIPIPLARFCLYYVMPYRPRAFDICFIAICILTVAIMVLHVSGLVSFGQIKDYFKIFISSLLVLYIIVIFRARQNNKVNVSPLFIFGISLLAALSIFDAVSATVGILSPTGTFFMVGMFFATVVIALLIWEYLGDALDAMEKNARLESDISAINRSLDLQRKHFQDFSQSADETRRMRHDLRHQLVAIKGLINDGKQDEALTYIDKLSTTIPSISEMLICDNAVVNSLAVYYLAQAEEACILCDFQLVVPVSVGRIPDADLSIIVGNLLENAIEACMHVEPEKRFIKVRCNTTAKRLTLVIDNSFDGELQVSGTDFYSRKRKGFGVGIASVRSVVSKYEGSMKYETESGVFKTSLYVKL
ncbi:MAG: GHKL domain-containing protein, partial [Coriobacteriia bacterium]|nr:GHKL domain-containing protein [Coriobacteriia bacterium]MCL2750758.1 GHKL domain-containing protein [Coriobacteriia bacterium]